MVPVVTDFTPKLVGDNAAHEIRAEAFVIGGFRQLWAATFRPFQLEFVVDQ
jgi:hypothetical protein